MNKFKKMRILAAKTVKQVCEETGVTETCLRNYEAGNALPRVDKLPLLAKSYNCTIEDFLEMYEKP